jgi:hypothetical protein
MRRRPAADEPRGDGIAPTMLVGLTSTGLAQPAQGALNALVDVTGGLVLHGRLDPGFTELLNLVGLHELRNRAIDHSTKPKPSNILRVVNFGDDIFANRWPFIVELYGPWASAASSRVGALRHALHRDDEAAARNGGPAARRAGPC